MNVPLWKHKISLEKDEEINMKIVLLGDSQRQPYCGYGKRVEEVLRKEGHEVFQPEDNSRFTKYLLRQLRDFRDEIKGADIIHFNAGHWDIGVMFKSDNEPFTSLDEYLANLRRIVAEMKLITPHIIFATTSPVKPHHADETNELIEKYNAAAVKLMNELGVRVNDIYSVVLPRLDECVLGGKDQIHPTEIGKIVQSDQVLKVIHEEMKTF